jgi:hypothetical protein
LSCRYAAEIPIVRSSDHSIVRPFVHSSYSSFIVRSSSLFIVHRLSIRLVIITIHRYYSSSLLFIDTIHHCYYSSLLFTGTIHHCYYSLSLLFIDDIYGNFFVVTIQRYYSTLLFIDHPIAPKFNSSSVMLSSPPKTSQTNISVIQTPVTVIFLPVGNFPSGHTSQVSTS